MGWDAIASHGVKQLGILQPLEIIGPPSSLEAAALIINLNLSNLPYLSASAH